MTSSLWLKDEPSTCYAVTRLRRIGLTGVPLVYEETVFLKFDNDLKILRFKNIQGRNTSLFSIIWTLELRGSTWLCQNLHLAGKY